MSHIATRHPKNAPMRFLIGALTLIFSVSLASAQELEYTLDEGRGWVEVDAPEPGTDAAYFANVRLMLAEDRPSEARHLIDEWLEKNQHTESMYKPHAYLLRGDAQLANHREFSALYDYERVIRRYPESDAFELAIAREFEIGKLYLAGLKRKFLGMRILNADEFGVEILIRVQERMPGGALAEEAAIGLADFYYGKRQLNLAREAYDLYLINFPNGPNQVKARVRRVQAEIAKFKGPRYDASPLLNAQIQIRDVASRFPLEAAENGLNEALVARLDESLAAQLLETSQWYLGQNDLAAARLTLGRLIDRYPHTISADIAESLMIRHGWIEIEEEVIEPVDIEIEIPETESQTRSGPEE